MGTDLMMTVHKFVAVQPLDEEPSVRPYRPVTRAQREEALADALRGVELGSWDKRILAWMPRTFDDGTLRTIVSLFERVREAGMRDVLLVAEAGVKNARMQA